jgi:hypothetical protein
MTGVVARGAMKTPLVAATVLALVYTAAATWLYYGFRKKFSL